ncbi:hypothetical protein LTS17_005600 [Exophiala oligosperma]
MKDTVDHSDAESFHSAISNTNKTPDGSTSSEDAGAESSETDRRISRPCSSRSRYRPNSPNPSIPRRQNSVNLGGREKRRRRHSSPKKDPAALHRQSCQLFSSLDGMLALSREFTPSPSVSTTRTATRHPSLVPGDVAGSHFKADVEERQLCHSVDQKLKMVEREQCSVGGGGDGGSYNTTRRSVSSSPTFRHSYSESSLIYQSRIVTPRISMSMSVGGRVYNNCGAAAAAAAVQRRPPLNTVISWTSNATRREEYEKIDRAHSGVRGFLRKMLPKCVHSKNSRRAFYTGGDGDSDSVRRFRMSLDETDETDETDHDDERVATEKIKRDDDDDGVDVDTVDVDEKAIHTSKQCHVAISAEQVATTTATGGRKHRWTCFQ